MPDYRRAIIPGGTFFFTVVTYQRREIFADSPAREMLGKSIRECIERKPFQLDAIVLLPDHLHSIWSLPPGDEDFSGWWKSRVPCPRFCVGMFRYHSKTKARRINNMFLDLVGRLNMPTLLRDVGMAPGSGCRQVGSN